MSKKIVIEVTTKQAEDLLAGLCEMRAASKFSQAKAGRIARIIDDAAEKAGKRTDAIARLSYEAGL